MTNAEPAAAPVRGRLVEVSLDHLGIVPLSPMQEAERAQALADLQAEGRFAPLLRGLSSETAREAADGFTLALSIAQGRLVFDVRRADGAALVVHALALGPFRRLVHDYQMLVESHEAAMEEGREARLQAIDMGRRGLHDEGARLVVARLAGKIDIDFATARRLFTLICVLHQRD
jgi:uncharacterized protein (UPF0262 family)